MKKAHKKILYPSKWIAIPSFFLGFFLLICIFLFHLENTWLAYLAYLWSTYDLIIFTLWLVKTSKKTTKYIKKNNNLYKWYHNHSNKINKISIYVSMILNLIYGITKFGMGLYYRSIWFITFAIYYLALWDLKLSLVKTMSKENLRNTERTNHQLLKRTGWILLLLNSILIGMIVLVIHQNQSIHYPGYLIYIIAMYDFYLIIDATIKILKYKQPKSPIVLARKCINLTVAMITILSLEIAMIYQFGNNNTFFRNKMISITGLVVIIINSSMAIYMLIKAKKISKNI